MLVLLQRELLLWVCGHKVRESHFGLQDAHATVTHTYLKLVCLTHNMLIDCIHVRMNHENTHIYPQVCFLMYIFCILPLIFDADILSSITLQMNVDIVKTLLFRCVLIKKFVRFEIKCD